MGRIVQSYSKLTTLPAGSIKAKGWIREQLLRNKEGMGGHLDELEPQMFLYPYLNNITDEKWGKVKAGWGAEISGNYWYGKILLAFALDDDELKAQAEKWVNGVLANQRENGYMGTFTENDNMLEDFNGGGTNCGMNALLTYYEATGREDVLKAVHRCMIWFCENWAGDRKTRYSGKNIIASMALTYKYTGDKRLVKFIDEYIEYLNKNDLFKNSVNALLEKDLVYNSYHAAAYANVMRFYALAYMANGEKRCIDAAINGVQKALDKLVQRTGGISSFSEYIAPIYSTAETEYCTFAFLSGTLCRISEVTGDPKYADYVERIVFNGAQGARKKDEKAIAYMSSPNQIYATSESGMFANDMQQYAPCYPTSCCPATSVIIIPEYVRYMALTDGDGNLYITTYGPAEINLGSFRLTSETSYPFRDNIKYTVTTDSDALLSIYFRIPSWCKSPEISVNGEIITGQKVPGAYFEIKRLWKQGDTIDIHFPMEVSISRVDDSDGGSKYPLAIEYGPLLFSLKIPEVWEAVEGRPRTTLPEGWSWWNVRPVLINDPRGDVYEQQGYRKYNICWNVAIDEKLDPGSVEIEFVDGGYVWENPQIKLKLPGYKALYAYPPYPRRTLDVFQAPIDVQEPLTLELVPYGCTNIRISYFTRAKI